LIVCNYRGPDPEKNKTKAAGVPDEKHWDAKTAKERRYESN